LALLLSPLYHVQSVLAQGCCSGSAPISANLGFSSAPKNTFQAAVTFDINNLSTLKDGERILTGSDRTRATYSTLLNLGYTFVPRFSVDVTLVPYVRQVREVVVNGVTSEFTTVEGMGDMVVLPKFLITSPDNANTRLLLAAGIKIPTGYSSIKVNSIEANPDLQPGSGAWDAIFWGNFYHSFQARPSLGFTSTINFRLTGANDQYLVTHIYEFGDDFHWLNMISDQFVLRKLILTPSIGVRYRNISSTNIDLNQIDNTGGNWVTSVFGTALQIYQLPTVTIFAELPVYSNVTGIQLSTSYRLSFGLQYQFGGIKHTSVPNLDF
jgi:hypothetical protein